MMIYVKKSIKIAATITLIGLGATISPVHAADFEDFARVINVTPQLEQVNVPRQDCRTEYETTQRYPVRERERERSNGGALVGGLAGGLLGSQIGGGNGKIAAAAVGAITGAIVGDRVDNNGNNNNYNNYNNNNYNNNYNNGQAVYDSRPVRQCRNIDNWETRTSGYAVTYEYHNRTYTSVMPYDPGNRLRLHVSITPRP